MKDLPKEEVFKQIANKAFKEYILVGQKNNKLLYRKSTHSYQGQAIRTRNIFGLREEFSIEQKGGRVKVKTKLSIHLTIFCIVYSLGCTLLSLKYENDYFGIIVVFTLGFIIHALIAWFISSSIRQELKIKYFNYYRAYKKKILKINKDESSKNSNVQEAFEATNVRFKDDCIELMRNKFVYKTIMFNKVEKLIVKNGMLLKNVGIVRVLCIAIILSMLVLIQEAISTPNSGGVETLLGVSSYRSLAYILMGPFALIILSLIVIQQSFISSTLIEIHSENNVKRVRVKLLDRSGETEELIEVLSGKVKLEDRRE